MRGGRLSRNAAERVRLPRVVKSSRGYLTHTQVRALAAGFADYGDIVLFLAYTGLGWGEMAALKVGRLDMLRRRIEVADAVSMPRGQLVWSTPKSRSSRSVPFPVFLTEPLARRCKGRKRDELVFVGPDGGVLRSGNFRGRQCASAVAQARVSGADFPPLARTIYDTRQRVSQLR